jgi:hypothetical protein
MAQKTLDPTGDPPVNISFWVAAATLKQIDAEAKRRGMTRSLMVRQWIDRGIKESKRDR